MNKERLVAILDHIKAYPETYNQTTYHSKCGSTHCIAGFAELAFKQRSPNLIPLEFLNVDPVFSKAVQYLGLTLEQGSYLFGKERTMEEIEAFAESGGYVP